MLSRMLTIYCFGAPMNKEFIALLQKRIGSTSIGPSTARGMGPTGTIQVARLFLQEFDLQAIKARSESSFRINLELATKALKDCLPQKAQHWGSSRKFLNIFLRNCLYNRFICDHYGLEKLEPWLEVPLDSHVAKGLMLERGSEVLPRWGTVIGLKPEDSNSFQEFAHIVADRKNISRIHLDLLYFRGVHMTNKSINRSL